MASPEIDYPRLSSGPESFGECFNIRIEGEESKHTLDSHEDRKSWVYNARNIPKPPPPPGKIYSKSITHDTGHGKSYRVPKKTRDTWEKFIKYEYGEDVHISTDNGSFIFAHSTLLVSIIFIFIYNTCKRECRVTCYSYMGNEPYKVSISHFFPCVVHRGLPRR